MKALFWLFVIFVVTSFVGVGFGFWKLFELAGLWFLAGLGVYVLVIIALVLVVLKLISDVNTFLQDLKVKLEAFVAKWGPTIKKVLKLLGIVKGGK